MIDGFMASGVSMITGFLKVYKTKKIMIFFRFSL